MKKHEKCKLVPGNSYMYNCAAVIIIEIVAFADVDIRLSKYPFVSVTALCTQTDTGLRKISDFEHAFLEMNTIESVLP